LWIKKPLPPPPPPIVSIREMGVLVSTGVELQTQLVGESREYRGVWHIQGNAMFGVDLTKAVYVLVDQEKRQAVLRLPLPLLTMWKINHVRSQELGIDSRVWIALSDKQRLRDEVWPVADRTIEQLAREEPSYAKHAKDHAKLILETLFTGTGWKVAVEFETPTPKVADSAEPKAASLPSS
jgi:hypothetical protein